MRPRRRVRAAGRYLREPHRYALIRGPRCGPPRPSSHAGTARTAAAASRAPRRQRFRLERARFTREELHIVVTKARCSTGSLLAPPTLAAAALFRATAVAAAPRSFDHGLRLGALRRLLVEGFPLRRRFPRRVHDGRLEDLVRNERDDIFVLRGAGAPVLHLRLMRARGPAICNVI